MCHIPAHHLFQHTPIDALLGAGNSPWGAPPASQAPPPAPYAQPAAPAPAPSAGATAPTVSVTAQGARPAAPAAPAPPAPAPKPSSWAQAAGAWCLNTQGEVVSCGAPRHARAALRCTQRRPLTLHAYQCLNTGARAPAAGGRGGAPGGAYHAGRGAGRGPTHTHVPASVMQVCHVCLRACIFRMLTCSYVPLFSALCVTLPSSSPAPTASLHHHCMAQGPLHLMFMLHAHLGQPCPAATCTMPIRYTDKGLNARARQLL